MKPAAVLALEGRRLELDTLFLDAGGVLVNPDWPRVAEALRRHGVAASAEVLAAAEPRAKRTLDTSTLVPATNDAGRSWHEAAAQLAQDCPRIKHTRVTAIVHDLVVGQFRVQA